MGNASKKFCTEIIELKEGEKEIVGTICLPNFVVEELTDKDEEIWIKFNSRKLNLEEVENHKKGVKKGTASHEFGAYLENRLLLRVELEE